ncbi:hypothetical protein ACHAXN_006837 [Cyclotella atomus]|jgi:hypothetical protein
MPTEDQVPEEQLAMEHLAPPALPETEDDMDAADAEMTEDHDAAIEAAVNATTDAITFDMDDSKSLIACIRGLQEGQTQQTQLIQKLHKTVLNTRTIINELIVTQNELKDEIEKLRGPGTPATPPTVATCENCKSTVTNPSSVAAAGAQIHVASAVGGAPMTPDEEIDHIIAERVRKSQWPVKHSTLNCFSVQTDLVKVRYHHSEKYQHIPIRIPKTEKNKDGTKPCKLCSEGKVRRKTTWMCATCEVPLCTRPLMNEEPDENGGVMTHHSRWHMARDLVAEHQRVHAALRDGRESRKRSREGAMIMHHTEEGMDMGHDLSHHDSHHEDLKVEVEEEV